MKNSLLILFTLMMASLMTASIALAQPQFGQGPGPGPVMDGDTETTGQRPMRPEPRGPLGQLVKFQHRNLTIAVLAELTGVDADTIAAELELSHPSEILATHDIDMETFIAEMDAKMTVLVEAAVAAGTITEDQGDEIIDMIINKPERPEPPTDGEMPPRFDYSGE